MTGALLRAEIVNQVVPLAQCRPHPQNYQRHAPEQIVDLRASLRKFGQVRSIVVQDDGADGFFLVAGHGLTEAARAEGLTELRADVIPADWPPVKVLAYLAADNELARRADPDQAQLAALVAQVQAADAELAQLAAGGDAALKRLLALVAAPDVTFPEYDESVADEVQYCECPKCGHKWPK